MVVGHVAIHIPLFAIGLEIGHVFTHDFAMGSIKVGCGHVDEQVRDSALRYVVAEQLVTHVFDAVSR